MMQLQTAADKLYFTTVRLAGVSGSKGIQATGFIYSVTAQRVGNPNERGEALFLVTNRHVVDKAKDALVMRMVKSNPDNTPAFGEQVDIGVRQGDHMWTRHPDPNVDVAVMPFTKVNDHLHDTGQPPFFFSAPSQLAATDEDVRRMMNSVEEVLFVGYPNALYDRKNLTPIIRRGTTATPPELDYCGHPAFLIDASVFPGSSGSPVFLLDRGTWQARDGSVKIGFRFMLLGVVARVHHRVVEGELGELNTGEVEEEEPDEGPHITGAADTLRGVKLEDPINLGIVYKARAIDECVDVLMARSGLERRNPEQETQDTDTQEAA